MGEGRAVREVSYFPFLQLRRMADGQNNTVFTKRTSSSNIHASAEQCVGCAHEKQGGCGRRGAGQAHPAPRPQRPQHPPASGAGTFLQSQLSSGESLAMQSASKLPRNPLD